MLMPKQEKEHLQILQEIKHDGRYKLPAEIKEYIKIMTKLLPASIVVRPWTTMQSVSFFHYDQYLGSLSYEYIEDLKERLTPKRSWHVKLFKRR
jgi:hypothetical protein